MSRGFLEIAALVKIVFINVQANMAAGARPINMNILFTNHKLPSIHSESVPRSRSKAIAEKKVSQKTADIVVPHFSTVHGSCVM